MIEVKKRKLDKVTLTRSSSDYDLGSQLRDKSRMNWILVVTVSTGEEGGTL